MSEEIKEQSVEDRVKEAIEMFRPQLQADGGDMEYIAFTFVLWVRAEAVLWR